MKNLFVAFFLLSETKKRNYHLDILQTTSMMKGTGKKLSDQTTCYEPRKKMSKIHEAHSSDLQKIFLWLEFVVLNVTISGNLFSEYCSPKCYFLCFLVFFSQKLN